MHENSHKGTFSQKIDGQSKLIKICSTVVVNRLMFLTFRRFWEGSKRFLYISATNHIELKATLFHEIMGVPKDILCSIDVELFLTLNTIFQRFYGGGR